MSNIRNILEKLLFEKKIRATELARETNVPQPTLHRILSGKSPNPHKSTVQPIADFFNISVEQLSGKQDLLHSSNSPNSRLVKNENAKQVPLISWENISSYIKDPGDCKINEIIYCSPTLGKHVFALNMADTSMEPFFPQGAVLIFDRDKLAKDRTHVLVHIADSDTYLFRQLLVDGENSYLKPLSPDLTTFQMRLLGGKDKILASLVEFRHCYVDTQ